MPASIIDLEDPNRQPSSDRIRLLLVEDEVIVAEDVKKRLEYLGYVVVGIATRGKDAVEMAVQLQPRLVLMDIGLRGGMDGIETVLRIREKVDVPVVFASAYSDDVTLERAKAANPQGFVLKPFEERELRTTIEMAIQKHGAERTLRSSESLFRRVFESLPDGLLVEDSTRHVRLVNPAFCHMFSVPDTDVLVGHDARVVGERYSNPFVDGVGFLRRVETIIADGAPVRNEELQAVDDRRFLMTYIPFTDASGEPLHMWQFHEIGPGPGTTKNGTGK